ncbi:hypothetical protein H8D30_05470 [bacterium]|nr:hypothetical protein [bacterium]
MSLFSFGNPHAKSVKLAQKKRFDLACKTIHLGWGKLKPKEKSAALSDWAVWALKAEQTADWFERAAEWIAEEGGSLSEILPALETMVEGGAKPTTGPWLELALSHGESVFRKLGAWNPNLDDDTRAQWIVEDPQGMEDSLVAHIKNLEIVPAPLLPSARKLLKRKKKGDLREAFVRGLCAANEWSEKGKKGVLWFLANHPDESVMAAWAAKNLSPPLSTGWREAFQAVLVEGARGKEGEEIRTSLARDLLVSDGEVDGLEKEVATLALATPSLLGPAARLLSSSTPTPQILEVLGRAASQRSCSPEGLAVLMRSSEDISFLSGLMPSPWPREARDALRERWQENPPVGHHPLLGSFLANTAREDSLGAFSFLSSLPEPLAPQARAWGVWMALLANQPDLAESWVEKVEGRLGDYLKARVGEARGKFKESQSTYATLGKGWSAVREGLCEEELGDNRAARKAFHRTGESPKGAARFARLMLSAGGESALREEDLALAGGLADGLRVEMAIATAFSLAREGEWEKAEKKYRDGWRVRQDPRCLQGIVEVAHRWVGDLLEAGQASEAREVVERALMIGEDPRLLQQWLGAAPPLGAWKRLEKVGRGELPPSLRSDLGWLAWRAGDEDKGRTHLVDGIRAGATEPLDASRLGRILLSSRYEEGSEADLVSLIGLISESAGPALAAAVRAAQGLPPPADFKMPKSGIRAILAAWALIRWGKKDEAIVLLHKVLEGSPRDLGTGIGRARGYTVLGYWFLETGDFAGAEKAWERAGHLGIGALLLDGLRGAVAVAKGVEEMDSKRYRRAETLFTKALSQPLSKEVATQNLATLHTLADRLDKAQPHWERLLQMWRSQSGEDGQRKIWFGMVTEIISIAERFKDPARLRLIDRATWEDSLEGIRMRIRGYRDLGVEVTATDKEIEAAYFRRLKDFGPEKKPEEYRRVEDARANLMDPAERERTDLFLPSTISFSRVEELMSGYGAHPLDFLVSGSLAGPSWRPEKGGGAHSPRPFPVSARGPFNRIAERWILDEPPEVIKRLGAPERKG